MITIIEANIINRVTHNRTSSNNHRTDEISINVAPSLFKDPGMKCIKVK